MLNELYDVWWPGAPGRTLRNKTLEEWEAAGCPPSGRRPGEGTLIGELRTFLQARMPSYMVPAVLMPLAAWPLTPSGKVDRRALHRCADQSGQAQQPVNEGGHTLARRTHASQVIAAFGAQMVPVRFQKDL